jgi:hypothetical protein
MCIVTLEASVRVKGTSALITKFIILWPLSGMYTNLTLKMHSLSLHLWPRLKSITDLPPSFMIDDSDWVITTEELKLENLKERDYLETMT